MHWYAPGSNRLPRGIRRSQTDNSSRARRWNSRSSPGFPLPTTCRRCFAWTSVLVRDHPRHHEGTTSARCGVPGARPPGGRRRQRRRRRATARGDGPARHLHRLNRSVPSLSGLRYLAGLVGSVRTVRADARGAREQRRPAPLSRRTVQQPAGVSRSCRTRRRRPDPRALPAGGGSAGGCRSRRCYVDGVWELGDRRQEEGDRRRGEDRSQKTEYRIQNTEF